MRSLAALAAAAVAAAVLGATVLACGKKGPPLPPLEGSIPRVGDLAVRQVGTRMVATFSLPIRPDADAVDYQLRGVELWRRPAPAAKGPEGTEGSESPSPGAAPAPSAEADGPEQPAGSSGPLAPPVKEFTRTATLAVSLSGEDLFRLLARPTLELVDAFEGPLPEAPIEYGLVLKTDVRTAGTVSNLAVVTPAQPPEPPTGVAATPTAEGISISWQGAPAGVDVFRAAVGEPFPGEPLNAQPVAQAPFVDARVTPGATWRYALRAVGGTGEDALSSDPTEEVTATWRDVFAPEAPKGLRVIAASARGVDLVWNPSDEPDLAGYHVYRRSSPTSVDASVGAEWTRIDQREVTGATYADGSVPAGAALEYAVTAYDIAVPPNESPRSEPALVRIEAAAP